jgi:hypothetical protein
VLRILVDRPGGADIDAISTVARTTFEWGPATHPKQGKKASA